MPKPVEYVAKNGAITYHVRLRDRAGRQTTETFRGPTALKEAERFCRTVAAIGGPAAIEHRARRDAADVVEYVPTVREWLDKHVEQLTGVTERTRKDYLSMAKRTWLPMIGPVPLDEVTDTDIARVINALEAKKLADKSIRNARDLLATIFNGAVRKRIIDLNPCDGVRVTRAREHERRSERFLTYPEYLRLLAGIPLAHRPLVILLFGTGLRWSEATALQVRDVRLDAKPPVVRVTKAWKYTPGQPQFVGPPKSAKSRRSVILGAGVADALEPLLNRDPGTLLFTTPRGNPIRHGNWRHRIWVPAVEASGLDPKPRIHDARHTHASWLLEMGASLEQVQDQLGHESILTTRKVYGHLQPAMRLAMADYATRALLPRPTRDDEDESPAPSAIALRP